MAEEDFQEESFQKKLLDALVKFDSRLSSLEQSFEDLKKDVGWAMQGFILQAQMRIQECQRYTGEYCPVWEYKSIPKGGKKKDYILIGGRYYHKDPGAICAICPHFEKKED